MVSCDIFEKFETVVRTVKGNTQWFGGLQIIAIGDFYQLPPVPNQLYGDKGAYVFESPIWTSCITHRVNLEKVYRQNEPQLVKAIQETARGYVTPESEKLLRDLGKEKVLMDPIRLFATNYQREVCNAKFLFDLGQPVTMYIAKDTGTDGYLKKIPAPKRLAIANGCPVILLVNLSRNLVNGLRGTVIQHDKSNIHVLFHGKSHQITKRLFTMYSPQHKMNKASRMQFPLSLAYGLTMHKSQSMTIDELEVNVLQTIKLNLVVPHNPFPM
jgi:ATP-dependent DNA helicase PIF1